MEQADLHYEDLLMRRYFCRWIMCYIDRLRNRRHHTILEESSPPSRPTEKTKQSQTQIETLQDLTRLRTISSKQKLTLDNNVSDGYLELSHTKAGQQPRSSRLELGD